MKIEVNEGRQLVLKEVFDSVLFQTEEGNTFAICMRDNTFEMSVAGSDKWYRANMDNGNIEEM